MSLNLNQAYKIKHEGEWVKELKINNVVVWQWRTAFAPVITVDSSVPLQKTIRIAYNEPTPSHDMKMMYNNFDGDSYIESATSQIKVVTTESSGTAKAYGIEEGLVNSSTTTLAWSLERATLPTVAVTDISGGKRVTFTNQESSGYLMYSTDNGSTWQSGSQYDILTAVVDKHIYGKVFNVNGALNPTTSTDSGAITVPKVATPAISTPISGQVTMTCATTGASIYYTVDETLDGDAYFLADDSEEGRVTFTATDSETGMVVWITTGVTPTPSNWTLYTAGFTPLYDCTIQAVAVMATGYVQSDVAEGLYYHEVGTPVLYLEGDVLHAINIDDNAYQLEVYDSGTTALTLSLTDATGGSTPVASITSNTLTISNIDDDAYMLKLYADDVLIGTYDI